MPVQVSWYDDEHTILYYKFDKLWELEELFAAINTGREMVTAEPHIVDAIFDMIDSTTIPHRMLASLRSVEHLTPANLRYSVAVGMNPFLTGLAHMVAKAVPNLMKNFEATRTLDDALAFIRDLHASAR